MHKLKVMQVVGAGKAGGAETFYVRMVRGQVQKSDLPVEVLPVVREGSWIAGRLEEYGIPFKTAPFGGVFDFQTKKLLAQYAEEFEADVIQTWMNRATKFLPNIGIPSVARLGGYYKLKYYRNVDHLVGNTEDICTYLKKPKMA